MAITNHSLHLLNHRVKKKRTMRPELDEKTDPSVFLDYYWLKSELQGFCRRYGIPVTGSKQELRDRIHTYLNDGSVEVKSREQITRKSSETILSLDAVIGADYKSDERHRVFFKQVIGAHFKFNVPFMKWMKLNMGCTYQEAVEEWHRIDKAKRSGEKFKIGSQFEYNQYMRDFFKSNPNQSRESAITCWKEKRSRPGPNRYEASDLQWLDSNA